jgi:hypothetical protein
MEQNSGFDYVRDNPVLNPDPEPIPKPKSHKIRKLFIWLFIIAVLIVLAYIGAKILFERYPVIPETYQEIKHDFTE